MTCLRLESYKDCAGIQTQAMRPRVHALSHNNMPSFHGLSRSSTEKVGNPVPTLSSLGCENMKSPGEWATPLEKGGCFSWNNWSHLTDKVRHGALFQGDCHGDCGAESYLQKSRSRGPVSGSDTLSAIHLPIQSETQRLQVRHRGTGPVLELSWLTVTSSEPACPSTPATPPYRLPPAWSPLDEVNLESPADWSRRNHLYRWFGVVFHF